MRWQNREEIWGHLNSSDTSMKNFTKWLFLWDSKMLLKWETSLLGLNLSVILRSESIEENISIISLFIEFLLTFCWYLFRICWVCATDARQQTLSITVKAINALIVINPSFTLLRHLVRKLLIKKHFKYLKLFSF